MMKVRPATQILDFLECLPIIGTGVMMGRAAVIEKTASKILDNEEVSVDGKTLTQSEKNYILLTYGNSGIRGAIQGFLLAVTLCVLMILGVVKLKYGITPAILGVAMIALAIYQTYRINKYLAAHPPTITA